MSKFNDILKNQKFRKGTISTIITVLFIAVVILINVLVNYLSSNHNLSLDLTKDQIFNLTDDSKNYIRSIDKDVEIIILNSEDKFTSNGDYFTQASYVIKQYDINSDKIQVKYVDITENPTFASEFPNEDLQTNSIIVRCNDKYQILDAYDLFNIESSYYYGSQITSSKAEQTMTSAIMGVVSDEKTKVTFIKGFDEEDFDSFSSLLKKNNYDVQTVSLLNEQISDDTSIVVIYAPNRDYDNDAIDKLNQFLDLKGKSVVFVANVVENDIPNLKNFLNNWDVNIGSGTVFETDPKMLLTTQSPFYAIAQYVEGEYTKGIKDTSIPVTIPFSKPIEVLNSENVTTLIESSSTSGIVPKSVDANWSPSDSDMRAYIPLVTLTTKTYDDSMSNNVCVIGSMIAFDNTFLSRTSLNNSQYFINLFNKLSDREDATITIESKSIEGDELSINAMQAITIGVIFTFVVPLIIFVIGLIVFIKRRHK